MKCIQIQKSYQDTKHGKAKVNYPCRKCLPCMITRRQEWTARLLLEMKYSLHTWYLTLTYNDLHLPPRESLRSSDLSKFLKRLRKNTGYKLRYFAAGEYGDKKGRPHYHLLIYTNNEIDVRFGYDRERRKMCSIGGDFHKAWSINNASLGFVDAVYISDRDDCKRVAAYVAGYVLKKFGKEKCLPGKEPEFQRMSRGRQKGHGLGADFVEAFAISLKKNGVGPTGYKGVAIESDLQMIRIDGKLYPFARYLRELVQSYFDQPSELSKQLRAHQRAFIDFITEDTEEYEKAEKETKAKAARAYKKYLASRI